MSIEHETLKSLFNDIAGAIRSRTGSSAAIQADEFPDAIAAINIHQGVEANKAVTITSLSQEVIPSSGYYSMAKVTATVRSAATIALVGVAVTDAVTVGTESSGYYPISAKIKGNVTVGTSGWYTGSSNLVASSNSQVGKIAKAIFAVAGDSVGCSSGGYVAANTTVGTVSEGTATVQNRTSGGTAIGYGKEVSLSEGYYSATKFYNSVAAGSATGNAGAISSTSYTQDSSNKKKFNITIAVTAPAPTVSAGYISSGSAGSNTNRTTSITITDAQAQAAVGAGSATTPATSITANPSLSTTYTSGSGYKMSVSATKSVTPTVSAGYVSAGTAGTITVTGEAYVPQNSFATGTAPSGVTPTSLSKNTVYKLSAGYYHEDRYYKTQADPTLSGDAAVGNVLSGKTFYSNSYTKQTGTMTNNGAVSQSIGYGGSYTIPAGYHNGSGKVTCSVGAGTIDVTDLTITPNALTGSWNSTTEKYVVSQASKTATMQSVVTSAGYVSSSVGTKNTGTATVSAPTSLEIPKAIFTTVGNMVGCTSAGYITGDTTVAVIAEGTAGTPTATKGTLSGTTLPVTPSVTNTTGYISGGTKTGTAINITPADLGLTKRTALSKSGGTVSIAANSYNTSALSVTVTRSDLGITDKAAATYNPSTSDQTISSGYYLTGTQTIKGITAITNSTYAGYLTSSTTARTTTIKTISGPTTADIYIYPSTSIYNYWANTYGLKISKPTQMTLPSTPSGTSSGTQKAVITPGNSALYINIPVGYNSTAVYYKINSAMPLAYSFMISDQESHYYGQGFESYPMFTGMTWAMAINAGISFYGIPIEKDGSWLVVNDGPYAGRPLMDDKYNVVDPSDVIQANSFYMFENE